MLAKLAYFVIERAAEPVSQRLENYAAQSPRFRATCVSIAQRHANLEYNKEVRRQAYEKATQSSGEEAPDCARPVEPGRAPPVDHSRASVHAPPTLSEKDATRAGSELLGEAFVLAVGLLVFARQAIEDRREEAENEARIATNEARLDELEKSRVALAFRVSQLESQVGIRQ